MNAHSWPWNWKLKNKLWSQTSQKVLKIQISKELKFFFFMNFLQFSIICWHMTYSKDNTECSLLMWESVIQSNAAIRKNRSPFETKISFTNFKQLRINGNGWVGERISLGLCVYLPLSLYHISLVMCVSQEGEHSSQAICVPLPENTYP